ncbi:MAG TPA: carboxypeptidase regulatory-like domain-containing protein, partial [Thermoanaerobaculia bacterium]|nr:carboxypeptidase regulatory-like domain-containing protein [Thermoanaerobaculia bacterium]
MRKFHRAPLVCFALLLGLGTAGYAQSQATTGVIEGRVVDESGAPLSGVTVTLLDLDTNFEKKVSTDDEGRFRGLLLPLGPYRITAALQGFSTLVREGIDLQVGQTVSLTFDMKVSAVEDQILVTADAPVVETTRTEGAT